MRRKKIQIFIIISNFKTLKFFDDVLVLLYIPKKVDFKNKKTINFLSLLQIINDYVAVVTDLKVKC